MPYADLGRQPITLWEHREAIRRLRAEGRRGVDEHAIFAAVAEQRRVLLEAKSRSKAARRALARLPVMILAILLIGVFMAESVRLLLLNGGAASFARCCYS